MSTRFPKNKINNVFFFLKRSSFNKLRLHILGKEQYMYDNMMISRKQHTTTDNLNMVEDSNNVSKIFINQPDLTG